MRACRLVLPIAIVALLSCAAPGVAATRHVVPSGATDDGNFNAATACILGTCSFQHALDYSQAGDTILLQPAAYSFSSSLNPTIANQTITTSSGRAKIVNSAASNPFIVSGGAAGLTVRNLDFEFGLTGGGYGINVQLGATNVSFDHITAKNVGSGIPLILGFSGSLIDSRISTSAAGGVANAVVANGGTIRNSTIVAAGTTGASAVLRTCGFAGSATASLAVTNTILRASTTSGSAFDFETNDSGACTLTAFIDYSDYINTSVVGTAPTFGSHNIHEVPVLDSAFQQPAMAPTIDRGTASGVLGGETDLFGDPRIFGVAPDIGADEFYVAPSPPPTVVATVPDTTKPVVSALKATKKKGKLKSLRFTSSEAGVATLSFARKKGKKFRAAGSQAKNVRPGTNSIKPRKLKKGTYRLRLTVKDAAGNASATKTLSFSTK